MIFDTHCHYNLEPFFADWQTAWKTAQDHGVTASNVIGVNVETSQKAIEISQIDDRLQAIVGIHPSEFQTLVEENPGLKIAALQEKTEQQLQTLTTLANQSAIKGVGETGLDYYRLPDDAEQVGCIKTLQAEALVWHLELAHHQQVPVIIHVRDQEDEAYWDVLDLLKKYHRGSQPFILHCVSGPTEYIKAALELGAYLGIAGNSTYKTADHIRSLIKLAPPERLLLETDAPFLPPQPHRGQVCQPWMIAETAAYLHDELGLDLEQIYENSRQLFL